MANQLGYGRLTASSGTAIALLVGGYSTNFNTKTAITGFSITSGATAHTWGFLPTVSRSTVVSFTDATNITTMVLSGALVDGSVPAAAVAANDYVAIKLDNGDWHLDTVSSWNGTTLTLVLNTGTPSGRTIKKFAPIVAFGVIGDAVHANNKLIPPTSATTNYGQGSETVLFSGNSKEPMLVYNANATAASILENLQIKYI